MGLRVEWHCAILKLGFYICDKRVKQFSRAVLVAPWVDVGEIEMIHLYGQDVADIVNVFCAIAAFAPAEFGDDDVFGGGKVDRAIEELNGPAPLEAHLIVGVTA